MQSEQQLPDRVISPNAAILSDKIIFLACSEIQ